MEDDYFGGGGSWGRTRAILPPDPCYQRWAAWTLMAPLILAALLLPLIALLGDMAAIFTGIGITGWGAIIGLIAAGATTKFMFDRTIHAALRALCAYGSIHFTLLFVGCLANL